MHDVKVLFLIPEIKILSIFRAAGEKLQGDIKPILLSGGCINTYITFDFNGSSEVTSKTRLSSMRRLLWTLCRHGEAASLSVGMMPVMATAMKKAPTIITRRRIVHCMHRWRECDHGSSTARLRTAQSPPKQPLRKTSVRNFFYDILNDCLLLRGGRVSRWEGYCWWHRRYLFILNNTCTRAQIVAFLYRAYKW